ncbi:MAG: hypothetical protein E7019_04785 [Alphaproteobacteria bacterium]|nr:hypothetical protein [Alphaproteobacteria bacterium]
MSSTKKTQPAQNNELLRAVMNALKEKAPKGYILTNVNPQLKEIARIGSHSHKCWTSWAENPDGAKKNLVFADQEKVERYITNPEDNNFSVKVISPDELSGYEIHSVKM